MTGYLDKSPFCAACGHEMLAIDELPDRIGACPRCARARMDRCPACGVVGQSPPHPTIPGVVFCRNCRSMRCL